MTEEELKEARKKYNDEVSLRERYTKIESKLTKLEKNPQVQEYLYFMRMLEDLKKEDAQQHKSALKKMSEFVKSTRKSNKIMVYMGPENFWVCYKDLETCEIYRVSYNEVSEFEKECIIIEFKISGTSSKDYKVEYEKRFDALRKEFLESLLKESQEEAIKKLVKGRKK